MPFDFNKGSARISMLFPHTNLPVELSVYGWCQMACFFCFANLNRNAYERAGHVENQTQKHLRFLERALHDERNGVGYFLRHKYPIAFSNTTDPFQREEKRYRATEAVLAWMQANDLPLMILTRGNVLYEEFGRYKPLLDPGRVAVYISITHQDDNSRRKTEPGALEIAKRWELVKMLSDMGIPVVVALNPYLREWVPDADAYCKQAVDAGAKNILIDRLHFSDSQAKKVPAAYGQYIRKANLADAYFVQELVRWARVGQANGIGVFAHLQWDAYFGCKPDYYQGRDPDWFGGKTWAVPRTCLKAILEVSRAEGGAKVFVRWRDIVPMLEEMGVENDIVSPAQFIAAYTNASEEFREMRRTLGRSASMYDILRYYWNHDNGGGWLSYAPSCRFLVDDDEDRLADDDGDQVVVVQDGWRDGGTITQRLLDDDENVITLDG